MPATTNVNFRTVVHEKSSGMVMFFPDVCKTPAPPAGPIPIPYPNIAQSSDTDKGSKEVKIDGCPIMLKDSCFKTSTGDEAGSAGGLMSSTTKGKAEFLNYSFDVKIEGKNVARLGDMMLGNKQSSPNTPPMPEIQAPLIMIPAMDKPETTKKWSIKKMEFEDPDAENEPDTEGSGGGSAARKGGAGAVGGGPSGSRAGAAAGKKEEEKKKDPVPTIKSKWGKAAITPPHAEITAIKQPGFEDIPDEAEVALEVDTTEVPDGTRATVEIYHAKTGSKLKCKNLDNLQIKGNKLVDPATSAAPLWSIPSGVKLWEPWDAPFYYFKTTVKFKSLSCETAKDFQTKEAEALRLNYWHTCVSDAVADAGGLTTGAEMNEISGILSGQAHHKTNAQSFGEADRDNDIPALLGGAIRNTFVYHQASHGNVGLVALCHKPVTATEISDPKIFPTTPKYLTYLNCCLTGKEPEFSQALIKRGTQNVIAFKISIPDNDAVSMAKQFYNTWCQVHKSDPAKIAAVYSQVSPPFTASMQPILYGQGAENADTGLSTLETVGLIIGGIAVGILIGYAAHKLIK